MNLISGIFICLTLWLVSSSIYADDSNQKHPCAGAINCDCNSLEAGILTRGWRADCGNCEKKLIEACTKAYPSEPLYRAMVKGGFCNTSCSVYGKAARPVKPKDITSSSVATPSTSKQMLLYCGFDEKLTTEKADAGELQGCKNTSGQWHGVVLFMVDGKVVEERVYNKGVLVSQKKI